MSPEQMIRRCHTLAGMAAETVADADSLIGLFQVFRPDGAAVQGLFDDLECGPALHQRLAQLYRIAGDDRRPGGGRDAYFMVRRPPPIDPAQVEQAVSAWLHGVHAIATARDDQEIAEMLAPLPRIRVLEGIPPKHPKEKSEQSHLLRTLQMKFPALIERIDAGPLPAALQQAYYFTTCDAMLRDYLMWPFYAGPTGLADPLSAYFTLWEHGAKYRIFDESQIDIYLPRANTP